MAITAADVKKLRDATGAGMMDSKKALEEAEGDFDRAIEILRIKGESKVRERGATRTASSGLVVNSGGALVELNSETDFVAKSEGFLALAHEIATAAERRRAWPSQKLAARMHRMPSNPSNSPVGQPQPATSEMKKSLLIMVGSVVVPSAP